MPAQVGVRRRTPTSCGHGDEDPRRESTVETSAAGSAEDGALLDLVPEVAEQLAWGFLVSRQHVEDEIDPMLRALRNFWDMQAAPTRSCR